MVSVKADGTIETDCSEIAMMYLQKLKGAKELLALSGEPFSRKNRAMLMDALKLYFSNIAQKP
jgi:hypothetical protein